MKIIFKAYTEREFNTMEGYLDFLGYWIKEGGIPKEVSTKLSLTGRAEFSDEQITPSGGTVKSKSQWMVVEES